MADKFDPKKFLAETRQSAMVDKWNQAESKVIAVTDRKPFDPKKFLAETAVPDQAQPPAAKPSQEQQKGPFWRVTGALGGALGAVTEPIKQAGAGVAEAFQEAQTKGYNPLQSLDILGSQAGGLAGLLMTPLTVPIGAMAGAFPKQAQQVKQVVGKISQWAATPTPQVPGQMQDPRLAFMTKIIQENKPIQAAFEKAHPKTMRALSDLLNIASVTPFKGVGMLSGIPAARIAQAPYAGAKALLEKIPEAVKAKVPGIIKTPVSEQLLRPKVAEYFDKARNIPVENIPGKTTPEKINFMSKVISEEGLHDYIGNPEMLNQQAINKANTYAKTVRELNLLGTLDRGNPVEAGKKAVQKFIDEHGFPAGNRKAVENALSIVERDLKDYNKEMGGNQILDFKQALNVDWRKGPAVSDFENAKNIVRKEMYHAANDLIKDPTSKDLLKRSSNLFKVSNILAGQEKVPVKTGGVIAGLTPLMAGVAAAQNIAGKGYLEHIVHNPHIAAALGLAGTAALVGAKAVKSGQVGRTLADIGQLYKAEPFEGSRLFGKEIPERTFKNVPLDPETFNKIRAGVKKHLNDLDEYSQKTKPGLPAESVIQSKKLEDYKKHVLKQLDIARRSVKILKEGK